MCFEVIDRQDKWDSFLNEFKPENRDVYFSYSYVKAHERNGDGLARCAIFEGKNGLKLMYPFIITRIPDYGLYETYFDISTCYGYGGPLVEEYNKLDIYEFEERFHLWCAENNIVAEFIRFHPIINNHDIFESNISIEKNRDTVLIDIDKSLDEIWMHSISGKNRNQIRKAEKSGVIIRENNDIEGFKKIYKSTMKRLDAEEYYYFNDEYYKELFKLPLQNIIVLEAIFEGKTIASAIFLHMGKSIHYHLSGSISEYMGLCPNNLMIFHGIKFGIKNGYKKMHLGGGTVDDNDDTLLRFKKAFSKEMTTFYIGKRIHNKEIYEYLIGNWEEKNNGKAKIFLQYEVID